LVYINDFPLQTNSLADPMLFADDTSVIISEGNFIGFSTSTYHVFAHMVKWFSANKLVSNLERTNTMKCVTINQPYCSFTVSYMDKCIEEAVNLIFLGKQIDNHLNWRNHIDQIIPKVSVAWKIVCSQKQLHHMRCIMTI